MRGEEYGGRAGGLGVRAGQWAMRLHVRTETGWGRGQRGAGKGEGGLVDLLDGGPGPAVAAAGGPRAAGHPPGHPTRHPPSTLQTPTH